VLVNVVGCIGAAHRAGECPCCAIVPAPVHPLGCDSRTAVCMFVRSGVGKECIDMSLPAAVAAPIWYRFCVKQEYLGDVSLHCF
jgi:hypothetical protein